MPVNVFPADKVHFYEALKSVCVECQRLGCDYDTLQRIEVASSEIISNICSYAYGEESGTFETSVELLSEKELKISFTDSGKPFNPLLAEAPDITKPLFQRKIGGMGIHLVRKLMDDVSYNDNDGRNHLILIKKFK